MIAEIKHEQTVEEAIQHMEVGGVVGLYKNGDHIQWFAAEFDEPPTTGTVEQMFKRISEYLSLYNGD